MNKKGMTAGLIVAGGMVMLGGAWYTGTQLESVLQQQISEANGRFAEQWPDLNIQLELTEFHRGVLSSDAVYAVHIYDGQSQTISYSASSEIEHGPFPLSRLRSLQLKPVMALVHGELDPNDVTERLFPQHAGAPVTTTTTLGYDGSISGRSRLAATEIETESLRVRFSGLDLTFSRDGAGKQLSFEGRSDQLQIVGTTGADPVTLSFSDMVYSSDKARHHSGLFLGDSRLGIDQIDVHMPGSRHFLVADIVQTDRLYDEAGMIAGSTHYNQGPLSLNGEELGSLSTRWTYSNLDPHALQALSELWLNSFTGAGADPIEALTRTDAALTALLAARPHISLDSLELSTANGKSELSLAVDLSLPASEELPSIDRAGEAVNRLNARLALSRAMLKDIGLLQGLAEPELDPQELAQRADVFVAMVSEMTVALGLAVAEGDDLLVTTLSYDDDLLRLNGNPIDPEALSALFALINPAVAAQEETELDLLLGDWQN
jgi:uncharacterized protein YdgA (DUF945 family)